MMRKILIIAAVLVVGFATAASAGYGPGDESLTTEHAVAEPGQDTSSTVTGCEPGTSVFWETEQNGNVVDLGTGTCASDGTATNFWVVPENFVPGSALVRATFTAATSPTGGAAAGGDRFFAAAGTPDTVLEVGYTVVEDDGAVGGAGEEAAGEGEGTVVSTLPRTGSSLTGPLLRTGVILLGLGALTLLVVRRRSADTT